MRTTYIAKREEALDARRWYIIDAQGKVLGRLATTVANLLRGKGKPTFTPHVDTGDFVIVINAGSLKLTGKKTEHKLYRRHTGYPGGVREVVASKLLSSKPERIIQLAVTGMLPKNRLGRQLATKLKIYAGADHPHAAQQPQLISV
ncbi:MAG: 50S ribosomal protein L13 [Deltaproteobacteria bacterium]|nr:50S ribosomal protein L13 [Deltaproteobacteria bacterium]